MKFREIEAISELHLGVSKSTTANNADLYQGKETRYNVGEKRKVNIFGIEEPSHKGGQNPAPQFVSEKADNQIQHHPYQPSINNKDNYISQSNNEDAIRDVNKYISSNSNVLPTDISVSSKHKIIGSGQIVATLPKICVIGVGGGGVNAVRMMALQNLAGVDIVAANTDVQTLRRCETNIMILPLGSKATKGLGTGGDPIRGAEATREVRKDIFDFCKDYDMIFLATGFGGGTGTGATPVFAEIAKEAGVLTVAVVTLPFSFEGSVHQRIAKEGLKDLEPVSDALVVIPNDNVVNNEYSSNDLSIQQAFTIINDVLINTVRNITDIVTQPGEINVDFADIKNCLLNSGKIAVGFGNSNTEERKHGDVQKALDMALRNTIISRENSELLTTANTIVVNTVVGSNVSISDFGTISEYIKERIDRNGIHAIKHGIRYDSNMDKGVKISIIAAQKAIAGDERRAYSPSMPRSPHDVMDQNHLDSTKFAQHDSAKSIVRVNTNYVSNDLFSKILGKSESTEPDIVNIEDESFETPAINRLLKIKDEEHSPVY